jgi:hypothetical protein
MASDELRMHMPRERVGDVVAKAWARSAARLREIAVVALP